MAAVPVSLMHSSGLPIMLPCSTMLTMNHVPMTTMATTMNYNYSYSAPPSEQQPQLQLQQQQPQFFNNSCEMATSPSSRSLSSASPPALMNGGGATTPTPPHEMLPEEKNPEYLKELQAEKDSLETAFDSGSGSEAEGKEAATTGGVEDNASKAEQQLLKTNHAIKLLEQEIARVQSGRGGGVGCSGYREPIKYVDVYRERPIRLTVRVLVPVREHPKFNFVGKLLGPKGNSMKRLQEETMTKMAVLGRGSMRDKQKEEELRASNDPKYQHLQEELHVEITAFAPPAEAHARIAYALTEVRKYLIPDSNDEIRQEQMREMEILAANGDPISVAAAAAAAAAAAGCGQPADASKRAGVTPAQAAAAQMLAAPNLAMMHPAFRPNLALATPQSIQSQAAAAAAMLRNMGPNAVNGGAPPPGMPAISAATAAAVAAAAAMRTQNGQMMATASPYIAAAPMIRKLVTTPPGVMPQQQQQQQQKLYAEEMMLEAAAVSQAPNDVNRDEGTENGDAWQGLKAPTVHHDQRSKFRQQTAPYIRPN